MHLECQTCGAGLNLEPNLRTAVCPYCASPTVMERPAAAGQPAAAFALGFAVTQAAARASVQQWLGSRGFFTDSRVRRGTIDAMRGLYVPAYLYSAVAWTQYQAEIGENYTETETYTTTVNGRTVVRTRTVTKTEYRSLAGTHASYLSDVVVTASRGLRNEELEAVEPFDMRFLRRYAPDVLSGWIAEDPTMHPAECFGLARGEALAKVGRELAAFMPGDSHRSLVHQTTLDRENADLIYVPAWVMALRHRPDRPPLRVLVNGQTAKVWGKMPLSWLRVTLVILGVLVAIALVVGLVALLGGDAR